MRILMLGWEYPPHISGGLGTACQGLTVALSRSGVDIDFVVPHLYGNEQAPHMQLLGASSITSDGEVLEVGVETAGSVFEPGSSRVRTLRIPSILSPYLTAEQYQQILETTAGKVKPGSPITYKGPSKVDAAREILQEDIAQLGAHYGSDLFYEVERYAQQVIQRLSHPYDMIHAHDWMTYPAGVAAAEITGRPLVVHVHSLEQDRSGNGSGNPAIVSVERMGLLRADRIIAVSHYTRNLIAKTYGIPLHKIEVVHNGVYAPKTVAEYRRGADLKGPVVLFLGRVTLQKGPDYFVEAAARVREFIPDARFIMAGSGDLLPRVHQRVSELGLEAAFEFPGFVRGPDVERLFSIADVYVMPSVSEPFGISALEAMSHDTPVILSRQSGVAEVLHHALKVDFWDVEQLASKIIAVLIYPELRESIVGMASEEVRRLHWDAAAEKTVSVYRNVFMERAASAT
jgi:glycosyltransferase involved in cell wall biosynthesis